MGNCHVTTALEFTGIKALNHIYRIFVNNSSLKALQSAKPFSSYESLSLKTK